jgi:hypothetical protein
VKGGSRRPLSGARGPGPCVAPVLFMAFCGLEPAPLPSPAGAKKKPLRFEHRRGGSLVSDQDPRGACGDETMTAAEETATLAANEAVPERIIDAA